MKKSSRVFLVIFLAIAWLILYLIIDPYKVYKPFLLPSKEHFLGTNSYGLDIFNIIFSSTLNLFLMCVFGLISFYLALLIGSTQGYLKGRYDFIFQRIYEVVISIPYFYIVILFSGYFSLNILNLGLILILFNWTFLIPLIRVQAIKTSQLSFIVDLQNIGYSKKRILLVHIIPMVFTNVKHLIPFVLILFMGSLTSLDFLGISSTISLGGLIAEGINYLYFPHILISSVGFVAILFISLLIIFDVNKYYNGV